VDKLGREWSPEAYINMNIRTTVANTAHQAQFDRMDDYDLNLVEVSSHSGARPKCAKDQGKIFNRSGKGGVTEDLNGKKIRYYAWSESSYGEPDGLLGINCGHQIYPFVPGISRQTYFPYDEEENNELYQKMQRQRELERRVRKSKRECLTLEKLGDAKGLEKASVTLKQRQDALKQYCSDNGLSYKPDRTAVVGYNRAVAGNVRKSLTSVKTSQYFRAIKYGESTTVKRGSVELTMRRVTTTNNNISVSTGCKLSRKQLHKIDTQTTKAIKKLHAVGAENLPSIYVVNHNEMQTNAIASYNAVKNILMIDEKFGGNFKQIADLQRDGACPDNPISTAVHELLHWSDAQEYRKYHGEITEDNYWEYIEHLNKNRKISLDKLEKSGYNVHNISTYAEVSYKNGDYDEVFTEYRVKKLLR